MAGSYLGIYDTTAGNNSATATNSVSVAEGMLPSNINNAFRDLMADVRQWYNTAEWIEYGDGAGTYTATYASSTSFTIDGVNVTSAYHAGRRIKLTASTPGTIYGSVTSTSFSTNTTVNVGWDSGSLSNEAITSVHIGAISASNTSLPETTAITGDYTLDVSGDIILDADGDNVTLKAAGTTVLDFVLNGATDVTLDAPGDIKLDAGGADIKLLDDGTQYGNLKNNSGELRISSSSSDTTAITMSGANVTIAGDLTITGDDLTMTTNTSGAALIGDGSNFNPVTISGDLSIGTTGTAAIGSGVVVNADVNSSAAIAFSKMANLTTNRALVSDGSGDVSVSAVTSTEVAYLDGVSSALQTQLDAKQATITGSATTIDTESLTASRAVISNASQKIAVSDVTNTELGYLDGVTSAVQTQIDTKAATSYVDNAVAGLRTRIICEAASTADVTISSALEAGDTIDGITLVSGDQVLLKDQSTASQNGIYTAVGSGAGAASRSTNFDTITELSGQMVVINQGTSNDNTIWLCTTNNTVTLGSDSIAFTKITPSNVGDVTLTGTQTLTNKTLTSPIIDGNGAVFEGATADAYETTLVPVDPTADRTQYLINQGGYIPLLAAVTTTAIASTPAELNIMDGGTSATGTTLVDADRLVVNDNGTMVQVAISDVKTYLNSAGYVTDDPTALAIALG
jgi:hypothetical protein